MLKYTYVKGYSCNLSKSYGNTAQAHYHRNIYQQICLRILCQTSVLPYLSLQKRKLTPPLLWLWELQFHSRTASMLQFNNLKENQNIQHWDQVHLHNVINLNRDKNKLAKHILTKADCISVGPWVTCTHKLIDYRMQTCSYFPQVK